MADRPGRSARARTPSLALVLGVLALEVLSLAIVIGPELPSGSTVPALHASAPAAVPATSELQVSSSPLSAVGTSHLLVTGRPATPAAADNPLSIYWREAAPIGIADMGVGANGVGYSYTTPMLMSNVTFTSQSIYNASLHDGGARYFTWQMNAFMAFVQGGKTYYWWIQDVATMDTDDRQITFMDCVWNATTASATLPASGTLSGNGSVSGGVYSDDASNTFGANVTTGVAGGFQMIIEAAKNSNGEAEVYFGFSDQDTPGYYEDFDTVTWLTFKHITNYEDFVVNGNAYDVWGTVYDAEIMVGGPFNGDFTVAHPTTDIDQQIYRWNGHNFEAPPNTWNFGTETAESISSVQTFASNDGHGAPEDTDWNGTAHNATPGMLYDQYQVGELSLSGSSLSGGTVAVGADRYPFQGNQAYLTLLPGTYHVWVNSSSSDDLGLCSITAGTNISVSVPGTCSGAGSGPTISSFTISPNPITLGGSTSLSVTASGGTAPLVYSFGGLPVGCASSNVDPLSCTPTVSGTFDLYANVTDAVGRTASAVGVLTVNPTVIGPLTISSFTANPVNVSIAWSTTLAVTTTGGTAPLSYIYTHLPPGCSSADASSINCVPTTSGHYNATVEVIDSSTPIQRAWANVSLWVEPAPPPLTIQSFTANPNPVTAGNPTTVNVTTAGGGGAGWISFHYSGFPSACPGTLASQFTCTPTTSGSYLVSVNASGSATEWAVASFTLVVNPASSGNPLSLPSFTATPIISEAGTPIEFTATAQGGAKPYTYAYSATGLGCSFGSTGNNTCGTANAGTFTVTATVTDSTGTQATASTSVTIHPDLVLESLTASPTSVPLGQSLAFTAVAQGGLSPYTFSWTSTGTGCTFGSAGNVSCTPTASGTFQVSVTVTDQLSHTAMGSVTITVTSAPGSSGGGDPLTSDVLGIPAFYWIAIVAAVAVAAVAAALLARRRPPEPPMQPYGGVGAWPPPDPYGAPPTGP
jgi:hypothetical protein